MTSPAPVRVKICGLRTADALAAASLADYIGLVFYPPSPRALTAAEARALLPAIPTGPKLVGLFVDPSDEDIKAAQGAVPLSLIQLHGAEAPARVAAVKALTGLPVMKAIRVGTPADIEAARPYEDSADWLLFDARVEGVPGGTGRRFDWSLLAGQTFRTPWMLSGGLTLDNVAEALAVLSPDAVDVSSGVEDAPGQKNAAKIAAFIDAVASVCEERS